MSSRALSEGDIQAALERLTGWTRRERAIYREFEFAGFAEAFGFMASVAIVAEKLDHHPDWSNSYRRVAIGLTTHDAGGLTELDFELARRINELAGAAK